MALRYGLTKNDTGEKIFHVFVMFAFWVKKISEPKTESIPGPRARHANGISTILYES
jgi:hypothetical protein